MKSEIYSITLQLISLPIMLENILTEQCLLMVILYDIKIPRVGCISQVRLGPVVIGFLVLCNIILHAQILQNKSLPGLRVLVLNLLFLSVHLTGFSHLANHLFRNTDTKDIYYNILGIGKSLNSRLTFKKGWILFLVVSTYTGSVICTAWITYEYQGIVPYYVNTFVIEGILYTSEILPLVIMKYLIANRIRYIRSSDEYLNLIEDTISDTRKLLECNNELNKDFQSLATTFAIHNFMMFQTYAYTVFAIHVAGIKIHDAIGNNMAPSFLVLINIFTFTVIMAWASSFVVEEVEELQLELDATLTGRPCTERQRKLITLFKLELHETPVNLSALGLFDVNKASFASGCCIMLSCLLVLMQFTN